jgi:hypothetical protein
MPTCVGMTMLALSVCQSLGRLVFIRKTTTRSRSVVESSFTFRLVASERTGSQVRQITLLNLGRHFDLPQPNWPRLCARIEALLAGQPQTCIRNLKPSKPLRNASPRAPVGRIGMRSPHPSAASR